MQKKTSKSESGVHGRKLEHLSHKALLLFFEGKEKDDELLRALQQAYKHFGCEEGMGHFEIIYITSAETQETFAASFRGMPWLTLPFTHALRREQLRHLFEASTAKVTRAKACVAFRYVLHVV